MGLLQLFFIDVCDTIAKQPCTVEACSQGRLLNPSLKAPDCIVKEMLSYYRAKVSSAETAAYIPPVTSPLTMYCLNSTALAIDCLNALVLSC